MADGRDEQGVRFTQGLAVHDIAPAHLRADTDVFRTDLDFIETGNLPQIDEQRRRRQPERHHRHQALAACDHFGLAVMRGEQRHGLRDACGARVFKRRQFHAFGSTKERC
jgi:hypothetical protein